MEGNHGSAGETTMLQSPYEENVAVACLEFWYTIAHNCTIYYIYRDISLFCLDDHLVERLTRYSIAHNGGVTKLTIKEEGGGLQEESRTQSIVWELESTNPESDGLWQVGQTLVKANNLVVIAEKGEKNDGFAAIDDLFFKIDPEFLDHCKTMPPSVTTKYLEKKLLNLRQIQMVQPHQLQTPPHPQVPFLTATLTLKEPLAAGRFGKRK